MAFQSMSGIYEIVNVESGNRYVGSAVCIRTRWNSHRRLLRKQRHCNRYLQAAWSKYGESSFEFRVLVTCEKYELIKLEQLEIDRSRPEYNLSPTAGSTLGVKFTETTRRNISIALKGKTAGRKRDRALVEITAAAHRGVKRSEETGRRIRSALLGRKKDPASVEAGASKLRGRKRDPEKTGYLIGNKHALGHRHTDEWKVAASARLKGRPCPKSPEHRAKIADALRGIPHSGERRANQSAGQTGKKRGPYNLDPAKAEQRREAGRILAEKTNAKRRLAALD